MSTTSTRGNRNNKVRKPVCAIALSNRLTVYVPGVTNALLAADWPVITRKWYRPVFDVFISVCTHIFGLSAVGYHWVVLGIYAVLTVLVGAIAEAVTGEKGIGLLSSFLFGIHSVHVEPVLWISASNELWLVRAFKHEVLYHVQNVQYLAVEVFTLPDNYGYLTSLPLWRQEPIVPILAMSVSAFSVGTLIWLYFRFTRPEDWHHLKFTCLWSIMALYPVILTATGRTAFMSSVGVIWSISILSLTAWNKVRTQPSLQRLFTAAMILFVVANLGVSRYRAYWWRQAGLTMRSVLSQLEYNMENIPVGPKICITGLPDHLRHAYTFRNAFPSITQRLYPDREIQVLLDNGLDNSDTQYECPADVWFHYQGGLLKRSE